MSQAEHVLTLVLAILEGREGQTVHSLIVTADRGYGKMLLMRELLCLRVGSATVMREHRVRCHPFNGRSFLNVTRNEEEKTSERA